MKKDLLTAIPPTTQALPSNVLPKLITANETTPLLIHETQPIINEPFALKVQDTQTNIVEQPKITEQVAPLELEASQRETSNELLKERLKGLSASTQTMEDSLMKKIRN